MKHYFISVLFFNPTLWVCKLPCLHFLKIMWYLFKTHSPGWNRFNLSSLQHLFFQGSFQSSWCGPPFPSHIDTSGCLLSKPSGLALLLPNLACAWGVLSNPGARDLVSGPLGFMCAISSFASDKSQGHIQGTIWRAHQHISLSPGESCFCLGFLLSPQPILLNRPPKPSTLLQWILKVYN